MRPSEMLLCGVLLAVFAPAWLALSQIWGSVDYYSHGYLVPIVAAGIAMAQRDRLAQTPSAPDGRGLALLLLGLGVYGAGVVLAEASIQGVAFIVAVAGLVAWLRGVAWLRRLGPAIGYLIFMIPLPEAWLNPVIVKLQLFVSAAGIVLLRAMGFAVYRDGNVLHLPGGESLFVAEACSGITSIVTLLPLAVFLAYFTQRTLSRRLVIVAAVLPLAMLGNLLRVTGTVVAVRRFGIEAAGGALHDSAGLLTYVLGCLALLGVGALVKRFLPEPSTKVHFSNP